MKILQVVHGYLPQFRGGTELYLHGLNRCLRAAGHEVEIVAGTTDTEATPTIDSFYYEGFRVWKIILAGSYMEHWTRSLNPDATALFTDVLRRTRPDVVHVHHWYRLSRDLIETCYRMGIPAICTLHDLWTSCPRIFRIREESFCDVALGSDTCTTCVPRFPWMDDGNTAAQIEQFRLDFGNELRLADQIIVPSRAHGDLLQRVSDLPMDRVVVLPHGTIVDSEANHPAARSLPEDAPLSVGVWGHLHHMKGLHLVLEALQELGDPRGIHLHVWGEVVEPRYQERLDALTDGLSITWHGSFVPKNIASEPLDMAIIPSLCSESFSFVLDEAFDLDLPVIVPNRGALAERIGDAGAVFEPEDSQSLATVLDRVLADPQILNRWRDEIPDLQLMGSHAAALTRIYTETVDGKFASFRDPDPSMLDRRNQLLADLLRQSEQLIFGYLGHIKRETGRGDHYESVVQKMIDEQHASGTTGNRLRDELTTARDKLVEVEVLERVLIEETTALRQALAAVHSRKTRKAPSEPRNIPDIARHIPGIGDAATLIQDNRRIIADHLDALSRLQHQRRHATETGGEAAGLGKENERLNDLVESSSADLQVALAAQMTTERALLAAGGMVDSLRKVMLKIDDRQPEWRDSSFGLSRDVSEVEVQDIGSLGNAITRNKEIIEQFLAKVRALHREREETGDLEALQFQVNDSVTMIADLGRLIEEVRVALTAVFSEDPEVPHSELSSESSSIHVPELGDIKTIQSVNRELIERYLEKLRTLLHE